MNSSQNCFIFTVLTSLTFYLYLHDLLHYDFFTVSCFSHFSLGQKSLPDGHSFYVHFLEQESSNVFASVSLNEIEKFYFASDFFHIAVR